MCSDQGATAPPFAVGLTGGIGSGKSLVADLFAAHGPALIDTDLIAHQLTAPEGAAIGAIRATFGEEFINLAGAMDRAKMRDLVFRDASAKQQLEGILHPLIRQVSLQQAAETSAPYVIFVVPLLLQSSIWRQMVNRILVVDCPEELQVERVMQRSGLSEQQVRAIMASQTNRTDRLAAADDVIENNSDIDALLPKIKQLHHMYLGLADKAKANPV